MCVCVCVCVCVLCVMCDVCVGGDTGLFGVGCLCVRLSSTVAEEGNFQCVAVGQGIEAATQKPGEGERRGERGGREER